MAVKTPGRWVVLVILPLAFRQPGALSFWQQASYSEKIKQSAKRIGAKIQFCTGVSI